MSDYLYTETQAKQRAVRIIKMLKKVFAIEHYALMPMFRYKKGIKGYCKVLGHYEKATVNINLENIKSLEDLELTCLHEIIHVVCAKNDQLCAELAVHYDDDSESRLMEKQHIREVEALTTHLTRVLYPLIFDV